MHFTSNCHNALCLRAVNPPIPVKKSPDDYQHSSGEAVPVNKDLPF